MDETGENIITGISNCSHRQLCILGMVSVALVLKDSLITSVE